MPMTIRDEPAVDARALLPIPSLDGLVERQLRGATCIWCGQDLTTDTAVDLGERRHKRLDGHYSTFPRGCRADVNRAAVQAMHDHAGSCEQCVDDRGACGEWMALVRLEKSFR